MLVALIMRSSDWWDRDGGEVENGTGSSSDCWNRYGGEETEETVENGTGSGGKETEETVERGIASDGQPWTLADIKSYTPPRPRYRYYAKP